jgi:hypothetical protein
MPLIALVLTRWQGIEAQASGQAIPCDTRSNWAVGSVGAFAVGQS